MKTTTSNSKTKKTMEYAERKRLYPAKTSYKNEDKMQMFSDTQKLGKLTLTDSH